MCPSLDRGYIVRRHVPAHDYALESRVCTRPRLGRHRLDVPDHAHVLPCVARLLLVCVCKFGSLGYGLSEGDLRTPGGTGDGVLALHTLDVNFEVELAHSRYDRLLVG
jgi:hypothetical protein